MPTPSGRHRLHVAWVGDTRAYWVPVTGPTVALTTDHTRSGALIGWLAADHRPEPGITSDEIGAGTVLVLTDGLWQALGTDPASALSDGARTDATTAVTDLFTAAGEASRLDDQTAAAVTARSGTG